METAPLFFFTLGFLIGVGCAVLIQQYVDDALK